MIQKILSSWRLMWLVQLISMVLSALCATVLPLIFPLAAVSLRVIFLWLLPPVIGAYTACRMTVAGIISYAAWIAPPVIHTLVPLLILGYPPSGLSMALCALISLVGAATGDVMYRRLHS